MLKITFSVNKIILLIILFFNLFLSLYLSFFYRLLKPYYSTLTEFKAIFPHIIYILKEQKTESIVFYCVFFRVFIVASLAFKFRKSCFFYNVCNFSETQHIMQSCFSFQRCIAPPLQCLNDLQALQMPTLHQLRLRIMSKRFSHISNSGFL